jgi:hypothetical protein
MKHYLQVTEAHYGQAVKGGAESGAQAAQNAAQQPAAANRTDSQSKGEDDKKALVSAGNCEDVRSGANPSEHIDTSENWQRRTRTTPENGGESGISETRGAESGAVDFDRASGQQAEPVSSPSGAEAATPEAIPTQTVTTIPAAMNSAPDSAHAEIPAPMDPQLTDLLRAWPTLSAQVKAGITAMVNAASGQAGPAIGHPAPATEPERTT